jgi:hypothetical protein
VAALVELVGDAVVHERRRPRFQRATAAAVPDHHFETLVFFDRQPVRALAVDDPVLGPPEAVLLEAQGAFDDEIAAVVVDDVARLERARVACEGLRARGWKRPPSRLRAGLHPVAPPHVDHDSGHDQSHEDEHEQGFHELSTLVHAPAWSRPYRTGSQALR